MSSWRDAPVVDDQPAWMSAPEVERRKEPRAPTSMGERFVTGLMDPIIGAGQIADRYLVNPIRQRISPGATSMEDVVRRRDAEYVAPEGIDWARMGGNIANPISWAGGGTGVARAAGAGAIQAALTPTAADSENFAAEKLKQAAIGGATAGALVKALPLVRGQVAKPTAEGEALLRQGVKITPGQAAGGLVNDIEQKLTSFPLVGETIQNARRGAFEDVQAKAIERAVGTKGIKTLDAADTAISDMYQAVVPKLKPTEEAAVDVLGAVVKAGDNPELTDTGRKLIDGLHDKLFGRNGERYMKLSGGALKDLDSELGTLGRKYAKSVLPSDQTVGEEIFNIRAAMRNAWKYHLDPADATKLDAANKAYARMVPIHKAASQRAAEVMTPRALQKAMARQAGRDVSRMPADPLLDPAVKALGATVPDSGTAGRLMLGNLASSVAMPVPALAAWVGAKAALSKPGVNVLLGRTAVQRKLATMDPAARKAFIAALRSGQAGNEPIDNSQD